MSAKLKEFFDNTPEKWTKGWFAKDKGGNSISENDPNAISWCIVGGLGLVTKVRDEEGVLSMAEFRETETKLRNAAFKLFPTRGFCNEEFPQENNYILSLFNDHPDTTFEDIKKVLEEADV